MAFVLVFKSVLKRRKKLFFLILSVVVFSLVLVVKHFNANHFPPNIHRRPLLAERVVSSPPLSDHNRPFVPALRVVHLDLKGAPPLPRFYTHLFPLLAALGANALLVEYEDMFPFSGAVAGVRALNAYSEAEVRRLVAAAAEHGLEVIPLVQTFGHLEFALKVEEFAHLREVPPLPQALCPSNNASLPLVREMANQVMRLHPKARFLHIGCDEVFQLGVCAECRQRDRDRLFLQHVHAVAEHVVRAHGVIPIVWDDMLRQMSVDVIRESGLAALGVELMLWSYVKDIYRFIPSQQFQQFAQLFPRVWFASAFKGAFGETLTVPNARWHLDNNMAWLDVAREQRHLFAEIRGLVLTGWSRYDHLAALCELLPAAVPSLALSLIAITRGRFDAAHVSQHFDHVMRCPDGQRALSEDELDADSQLFRRASACEFAGADVFRLVESHAQVVKRVTDYLYDVTEHKAWLTLYNVRRNLSNPYRVDEGLQDFQSVYYSLQSLMRSSFNALTQVFHRETAFEWIEQNVYPLVLRMELLMNSSLALKRAQYWPRRPLPILADLERRLSDQKSNF